MVGLKPRISGVRSGTYCQLHHHHLPFHRKLGKHIKSLPSFFLAVSSIMSLGKKRPRNWSLNLEFGLSWFGAKKRLELSPPNLPSILIRENFFADIFLPPLLSQLKIVIGYYFIFAKTFLPFIANLFFLFCTTVSKQFFTSYKKFFNDGKYFYRLFLSETEWNIKQKNKMPLG